jgi:hypothetical protein
VHEHDRASTCYLNSYQIAALVPLACCCCVICGVALDPHTTHRPTQTQPRLAATQPAPSPHTRVCSRQGVGDVLTQHVYVTSAATMLRRGCAPYWRDLHALGHRAYLCVVAATETHSGVGWAGLAVIADASLTCPYGTRLADGDACASHELVELCERPRGHQHACLCSLCSAMKVLH